MPASSPKQPVKNTKSNAKVENGPPELPPARRDDKPPPLPPVNTIPSRKNLPHSLPTPEPSPKEKRPPKSSSSERPTPPKMQPYRADRPQPPRERPDLPSRPKLPDKKPQVPPGRPALPERFAKQPPSGSPRLRTVSVDQDSVTPPRPPPERKANTMKPLSTKTPLIPNQSMTSPNKITRPVPPGRPRKHGSIDKSSSTGSNTSFEPVDGTGINTNNPAQVMEEINRISTNLSDIASEGLPVFNRSLENFAELSEQMLTLLQGKDSSVSTRLKVSQLRDKIGQYRGLMKQINLNPSRDYTSQLDSAVSEISKRCGDLYTKLF